MSNDFELDKIIKNVRKGQLSWSTRGSLMKRFFYYGIFGSILFFQCFSQADLQKAFINCKTKNSEDSRLISGYLDFANKNFSYIEVYGKPRLVTHGLISSLDSQCGTAKLPLEASYNFDITGPNIWGQDVLQLPIASLQNQKIFSFSANLHTCAYDGDWNMSADTELECDLVGIEK